MIKNRNLTLYYSIHQIIFWTIPAGVISFATVFLLDYGYSSLQIGLILFGACFLSFVLQPIIGSLADKANINIIPLLMLSLSIIAVLCFGLLFMFKTSKLIIGILYLVGSTFVDIQIPLLNSVNVYYSLRKWNINYGIARGIGGAGYGVATIILGNMINTYGVNIMPISCICLLLIYGIMSMFYPKDESKVEIENSTIQTTQSIYKFINKYKWYTLSLFTFLLVGSFHIMVENFLIVIVENIGKGSSEVGLALSIAAFLEVPTTALFSRIYKKIGPKKIIYIGTLFYIIKAIILLFAKSIMMIYIAQLMQIISFVFINTVETYYAKECTSPCDMVKSQTLITAFYSLGSAFGNLSGGTLLEAFSIKTMLIFGVVILVIAMIISFLTVQKALDNRKYMALEK